ncbi:MAG: hypothetical protein ACTXOO_00460 [Sodalis sp. (in: enterobacteria)]
MLAPSGCVCARGAHNEAGWRYHKLPLKDAGAWILRSGSPAAARCGLVPEAVIDPSWFVLPPESGVPALLPFRFALSAV